MSGYAFCMMLLVFVFGYVHPAKAQADNDMATQRPSAPSPGIYVGKKEYRSVISKNSGENFSIEIRYDKRHSSCIGLGDSVACLVRGPSRVKLKHLSNVIHKTFDEHQSTLCYSGPQGMFCEGDRDAPLGEIAGTRQRFRYDRSSEENPLRQITDNARRSGHSFETPGGSIHFETMNPASNCFSAKDAVLCRVAGPDRLRLVYENRKDNFADRFVQIKVQNTLCYAGRHGLFCDDSEDLFEE